MPQITNKENFVLKQDLKSWESSNSQSFRERIQNLTNFIFKNTIKSNIPGTC